MKTLAQYEGDRERRIRWHLEQRVPPSFIMYWVGVDLPHVRAVAQKYGLKLTKEKRNEVDSNGSRISSRHPYGLYFYRH